MLELKRLVALLVHCFTYTESKHLHQIAAGFQSHVQPSSAQRTPIINQPNGDSKFLQSKAVALTRLMDTLTALCSRPTSSTCGRSSAQIRSATFMGCKHTQSRRQCSQRRSSHQRHPLSPDRPLATAISSVYPNADHVPRQRGLARNIPDVKKGHASADLVSSQTEHHRMMTSIAYNHSASRERMTVHEYQCSFE